MVASFKERDRDSPVDTKRQPRETGIKLVCTDLDGLITKSHHDGQDEELEQLL